MNELQMSLVGLGGLAILIVLFYNRWLERKYRRQHAPQPEPSPETGAAEMASGHLTGDGRQEPQWSDADGIQHTRGDDASSDPALAEGATEEAAHVARGREIPEPLPNLSDAEAWVDAIATLRFYQPRSAGSIRETIDQVGVTRFERVEFYTADGWHLADKLPSDALVSNIRCRLQLATRRGPVAADTLHEWIRVVESLAQMLSAGLSVESESKLLERAGMLDAFCARVDALISLNLRARDATAAGARFADKLGALGLAGDYPAFARLASDGAVDFQVVDDVAQGQVSLILDFPHVTRPDLVVADMLELARALSISLDADIVDDSGRPLGDDGMALLANQAVRLSAMLQAQGIEPGSALSRRLFS